MAKSDKDRDAAEAWIKQLRADGVLAVSEGTTRCWSCGLWTDDHYLTTVYLVASGGVVCRICAVCAEATRPQP